MDPTDDSHDAEIAAQADAIAAQITELLVKGFKAKQGREPTDQEINELRDELTVERIECLLSGEPDLEDERNDGGKEEEDGEEEDRKEVPTTNTSGSVGHIVDMMDKVSEEEFTGKDDGKENNINEKKRSIVEEVEEKSRREEHLEKKVKVNTDSPESRQPHNIIDDAKVQPEPIKPVPNAE